MLVKRNWLIKVVILMVTSCFFVSNLYSCPHCDDGIYMFFEMTWLKTERILPEPFKLVFVIDEELMNVARYLGEEDGVQLWCDYEGFKLDKVEYWRPIGEE